MKPTALIFTIFFSGLTRIFGTFNVHDRRNDNFRTLRASKVIMHKDYDRSTFSHDIAVLHFNAKVK